MANKKTDMEHCPCWLQEENRCSSKDNGLFIPFERHIVTYCNGPKHEECNQFKTEQPRYSQIESDKNKNRRKHKRVSMNDKLLFYKLTSSGNLEFFSDSEADILDLSSGGMRIRLHQPLFHDTMLQFTLVGDDVTSNQKGMARVRWCSYEKDEMGYSAGLAFADQDTIQTVNSWISPSSRTDTLLDAYPSA